MNVELPQFLFDECLGYPLIEAMRKLIGFHRQPIGVIHLFDRFPPGTHDEVWVPAIAKETWIVVSVDRGRSPGSKLPNICALLGVRHILPAPSTARLPQFSAQNALSKLKGGEKLQNALELNNPVTRLAHQVDLGLPRDRCAPRYPIGDLKKAIDDSPEAVIGKVVKVNPAPVPANQRVLIELAGRLLEGHAPMSSADFQLINA